MSDNTDDLMSAVGLANDKIIASSTVAQSVLADQKAAADDSVAQTQTANADSLIVQKAKMVADLDAQNKAATAATRLGTNQDDASNILGTLADEWKSSTLDAIQTRKNLHDALNVKFFDDPIGYVKAQIGMEQTVKQAQAASDRRNDIENSLNFAQQQTQQAVVTANALKKTVSDTTIQATLEGAAANMNANLDTLKVNNAGIQIKGLQDLNQMTLSQINNLSTGVSAQNQAAQLEISRANLANSTKSLNLSMQERQDRIAKNQADKQELEGFADTVRTGAAALGYDNVKAFPTNKIIQLVNMKADHFQDFLSAGMQTQTAGHPVVSPDAGQSTRIISQTNAPLRPEQQGLKQFFANVWSQAASPESGLQGRYDPTKVDQVTKAAGAIAVQSATKQLANIKPGDNTNIYAPPALESVVSVPAIANSEFYKKILGPQVSAGGLKEFNPEQLISLTTAGIKAGTISYNDAAAGLQGMFGAARSINNRTKNYIGYGLPPQVGYKVGLLNGVGFTRSYDLTTQQDINNLLNSRLSTVNEQNRSILDTRPFGIFN